jgi:hypothetical protein
VRDQEAKMQDFKGCGYAHGSPCRTRGALFSRWRGMKQLQEKHTEEGHGENHNRKSRWWLVPPLVMVMLSDTSSRATP